MHGRLIAETLGTLGVNGPVAFYGELDAGYAWQMIGRIRELAPSIEVDASFFVCDANICERKKEKVSVPVSVRN